MRSATLYHWLWQALDALFPPCCGGCGKLGTRWCATCQARLQSPREPLCYVCGQPLKEGRLCLSCADHPPAFRLLRSWAIFQDPIRPALHRLKYRRDLGLGEALAVPFARFVCSLNWPVEVIVPVPLSHRRYRERGYNQVALFAYPLAMHLQLPYHGRALQRVRETRSQVGLSAVERRANVHQAFVAEPRWVDGRAVLLVDDVATTGATLSACAEALQAAGAKTVYAVTIARAIHSSGGFYDSQS